ncbi:MAG TPA: APC family permease [Bryobacteraceae bacterium]|nr:APC family permease [Bryobacteraceae bacterium]
MGATFPEPTAAAHSGEFRKELGLRDLLFAQVINIVGLTWVGVAAKLGPPHLTFWLLAVLLFYLPSVSVVVYLNRLRPLEGGLYTWARLGFNDFTGFMVAWSLWLNCVVLAAEVGIQSVTILAYAIGARGAAFMENKWLMAAASVLIIAAYARVAAVGLGVGKWVNNAGGALFLVIFLALIVMPFRSVATGRMAAYQPLTLALPTVSLLSLNILAKIGFGAMAGSEYIAIFAGECRDAARSIGRAVVLAAPLIVLLFILGTSAVRALVPDDKVDLVSPISQALAAGTGPSDTAALLIPLVIIGMLLANISQQNFNFTAASRLPLVAGWDHLLPKWFTRLDPKHQMPSNSILLVGIVTIALGIASLSGAGQQEAFQLLQNAAMTFYSFAYLVMFALPLIGFRGMTPRPPLWLRAAAVSGFVMTALFAVMSVFPIIDVPDPRAFTIKVTAVIVLFSLIGAGIFFAYRRKGPATRSQVL